MCHSIFTLEKMKRALRLITAGFRYALAGRQCNKTGRFSWNEFWVSHKGDIKKIVYKDLLKSVGGIKKRFVFLPYGCNTTV